VRAKLWTAGREQAWRKDYQARLAALGDKPTRAERFPVWRNAAARPGPVMVWLPEHLGRFLDAAASTRLYGLYLLMVTVRCGAASRWGCRCRRCPSLRRPCMSRASSSSGHRGDQNRRLHGVCQHRQRHRQGSPRDQENSSRPTGSRAARRGLTPAWSSPTRTGRHITRSRCRRRSRCSRSSWTCRRSGCTTCGTVLPHWHWGADMTAVSRMLRHASIQMTADIYTWVLPELAAATSAKVVKMVPRAKPAQGSV
jgi:hypothetical protein